MNPPTAHIDDGSRLYCRTSPGKWHKNRVDQWVLTTAVGEFLVYQECKKFFAQHKFTRFEYPSIDIAKMAAEAWFWMLLAPHFEAVTP